MDKIKCEYLKDLMNEANSKNKNIRDIHKSTNELKGYKARSNLVKYRTNKLLAE
jgi:hypothetical protein